MSRSPAERVASVGQSGQLWETAERLISVLTSGTYPWNLLETISVPN